MARLQQTEAKVLDTLLLESNLPNVTLIGKTGVKSRQHTTEWELNRKLQTSLDISTIIRCFAEETVTELEFQQLQYVNENSEIELLIGDRPASHSCNYKLMVADESLGKLSFFRKKRFTETELNRIEELLCLLVYPLRNALMYKAAIQQAMRDPLTGTLNRAALDAMLGKEIELAQRLEDPNPLSVLMVDVDHFKQINDHYGHNMGDNVLRALVERVNSTIRSSDILFRYGGEEFTIILNNTDPEGALLLAERVREAVEEMIYVYEDTSLSFTVSIGVASLRDGDTPSVLLERSDKALYIAKGCGRNKVVQD